MKKRIIAFLLAMLLVAASFAGCAGGTGGNNDAQAGYPLTITDDLGNEVTFETVPEKILSSSPSITEIVYALGLEEKLVGVTAYCDYPLEAKEKPQLIDFAGPNVERIIEAAPDVLFSDVAYGIPEDTQALLDNAGIKIVIMTYDSIDDVLDNISLIGQVMDVAEPAQQLRDDLTQQMEEICSFKVDRASTVFVDVGGFYTTGSGTYLDDMIQKAGAVNVAASLGNGWVQIPVETLLEKNPDVYIDLAVEKDGDLPAEPLVQPLAAIQEGRVYTYSYSSNETAILSRPGPRFVEALRLLVELIYPEAM